MKIKALLMAIIMSAATAGFASYQEALKLFQEKKYEESLKILAGMLVVDEDLTEGSPNYKIRYLAAHNHWKLGNSNSVVIHFRRCMLIDKTTPDPYIDLALFLLEDKRGGDAASTVAEGLKVKEHHMLHWISGRIAMERGDFNRAKDHFEKANALNPEFFVSYNDLGISLMRLKRYGEANAAFSVALAIKPDSAEVNHNLALCYSLSGKMKEALTYAEKAAQLDPENTIIKATFVKIKNPAN